MLDILFERLRQKHRTFPFPSEMPALPPRFRGRPYIDPDRLKCLDTGRCDACAGVCPTGALSKKDGAPAIDMGLCLFCGNCSSACPAITFTGSWQLAATRREDLLVLPGQKNAPVIEKNEDIQKLFGKSFRLRQVSAAGCNACEADLNVLTTLVFDISRFGIDFVPSPRHADALAVTGPVPRNMQGALLKCDTAASDPHLILAVGACAISGGIYKNAVRNPDASEAGKIASPLQERPTQEGVAPHLTPALYIPGCPPHPYTTLDGLLRLIGRMD